MEDEEHLLAQRLHEWYLEACKNLKPENYNNQAQVSWEMLNEQQKKIDQHIAKRIMEKLRTKPEDYVEDLNEEDFVMQKPEEGETYICQLEEIERKGFFAKLRNMRKFSMYVKRLLW